MRALFGVCHGIVRHSFRADTHWRGGFKEEILPRRAIHRHRDFAVIECVKTDGTHCTLKVTNSILACMSTSESSQMFTWKIGGCLQMGVVRSVNNQNLPDPFLMNDQPNILPGCTDPSYRPLLETFEPWAQDYARSELVTGFGLIQEDTALWEPWCWRFANLSSTDTQTTFEYQKQSGDADIRSTASGKATAFAPSGQPLGNLTSPPTCHVDLDATFTSHCDVEGVQIATQDDPLLMLEPWAYAYVHHDMTGSSPMNVHEDQYCEPWGAHFISSEMRTKRTDPPQSPSGCHLMKPEGQPTLLHRVSTWFKAIVTSLPTGSCSDGFRFSFTQSTVNTKSCWNDVLGLRPSCRARLESFFRHFGVERGEQHTNTQMNESATAILFETPFHPPPDLPSSNIRVSPIQGDLFGSPKHADHHDVIHQANRIDIPTTSTFTSTPHCWTAFQASCTVRLTTVRDVLIPPCLPLFQPKCPSCVNQHEIASSHVTTNLGALNTFEVQTIENPRPTPADLLDQSRPTPVIWHTGFCHKNDHDRLAPGPPYQTINSGAVPDFTTSGDQETVDFDSVPSIPHDYIEWSRHFSTVSAPRPLVVLSHGRMDFSSLLNEQWEPDQIFESLMEPHGGGHQQHHALQHWKSDVQRVMQILPMVTNSSHQLLTRQQDGLLISPRSVSNSSFDNFHLGGLASFRPAIPVGSELRASHIAEAVWVRKDLACNATCLEQSPLPLFDWAQKSQRFSYNKAHFRGISLRSEENYTQMSQQRSILVDTALSSLKPDLLLPQHLTTYSGAVPSINHYADFRPPHGDLVFSDGVLDLNHFASTALQDLIRVLTPLRSALLEPYDSQPARSTLESLPQQGVRQKADECVLASQFFSEEDHRPQHFTTWSGAVPSYNSSISDSHNIRYMINPRVLKKANSSPGTTGNTFQELHMPVSFRSPLGFLRADACHMDLFSDQSLGCAQNLGCMPPVQSHPEWLNQNNQSGIRDAFIPPQPFRHTKTRHQTNTCPSFGFTESLANKGMNGRIRNPMYRDSVPYDCRQNQSVIATSSGSHWSSSDNHNDQLDIEITSNDSYPETTFLPTTINSAISWPSNSTFSQTDDELQVTDDRHQTMSRSAKLRSFTTFEPPDPKQSPISSGAVPVDNLNFRQHFDDFDIRSYSLHPPIVPVEMLSGYNANLCEQLHFDSQLFPHHHQALHLIFDLCHTNAQFRYVPATIAEVRTSNNFLPTTSPVLQHFTISSGAVPANELNSMSIQTDLLPSLTGSVSFVPQHWSDKYPSDETQVSVHLSDLSTPNLQHRPLCGGALSRHIFQELYMDHHFDDQMYCIFDCKHKDVSFQYPQQLPTKFWPADKCRTQAHLWPPPFSSSIRTSAVRQYCQEEARATALAPQQITISNGAVPSDNNLMRTLGLPGGLFTERIFPTVPNYVSKFEEKVYVSLPSRGSTYQLTLPKHRNNVVAAPRTVLLNSDPRFSDCLHPEPSWTHNASSVFWPAGGFWDEDLCPTFSSYHFRGWSKAIYSGGHPAWGKCQVVHMNPNPPFAERCAAALQDDGWLASDEALWFLRKIQEWRSDVVVGPMIQWSPSRDLRHLMASEDQLQCNNHYLTLLLFLVEAHWCAVEVDRRTSPVHVVLIQWPEEYHSMITLEISRILQIPSHRMLVTVNSDNEIVTMCGWTILHRWYHSFAMQTCLQPLIFVAEQYQDQLDRVTLRAQHHWGRTNASADLRQFATECRQAFLSEYARDCPDTRLPPGISTTMFVGPTQDYIREACQVPRPPTNREREINWLRTMLIQPAWLTNFELELVLQTVRLQMLDRYIPSPLHFDSDSELLEPFTDDLPTVAGYTKVLFFITYHYHWISISGIKHQNRWMLTAAVPDPQSAQLPLLFAAVATILESSPDRIHVQATATRSPPHLCGWILLHSLQDHVQMQLAHDTTLLLQRIAVMPNSRIKNLLFEEALGTWTRHAPHQELISFATQVRVFFLAHMDTWTQHHKLHFGGMFQHTADSTTPASWHMVSPATKTKILGKLRAHVQRPYVCQCVQRLTAFVEIDRFIEAREDQALFSAFVKPSPLQWSSQFCQENVMPESCTHDKVTEIYLRVPKQCADLIPSHIEAIVFQGKVQFSQSQVLVSILDLEAGLRLFRTGRNHPTGALDIGEFCSGAFSGWTQAAKVLETMGYSTNTKFAIDRDPCVATWYSRNFTSDALATNPDDVFKLRQECFHYREAPITFQTDVDLGWYMLFCEPIEIATASPPCPAFSAASTSAGLEKAEGQVIIDTILKIMLLQPKIMVLEEVATLRSHAHFPLILALLNWGNFQVAWQDVTNLEEWLPQSRPRLLLIAIRRCSYGLKHFTCQVWKPNPIGPISLQQSDCLLHDDTIIQTTTAPLDFETAKLYFDPHKIPGATPRSFKDTVRFRLRTKDDRIQCIMASYGFGHEIDASSSSHKGIFGSLIRSQGQIRFLAGPELLWLQGLSVPWRGPLNPRLLNHIVGNAISVPHALLGLLNTICHFAHLEFETFPHDLFQVAMQSRLHATNSDCVVDMATGTFIVEPKQVPLTAPWDATELFSPELTRVDVFQGNKRRRFFVQPGIPVLPVMTSLFSAYDSESILWLPYNRTGLALPITATDHFCGECMTFSVPESYRLCFQEQSFHTPASHWTAILLPDRLVIYQVGASTTIAALTTQISADRLTPYQLCNHMLKKWEATAFPCQAVIAQPYEICHPHVEDHFVGIFLDHGDWLQAKMDSSQAQLFLHTCHSCGLSDLLWALGWNLCQLQEPHPDLSFQQILIVPSSTQLFVDASAVRNIVAAHITTWYIPASVTPGPNSIRLSLKLWATVVWEGFLPFVTSTDVFARAWMAASRFMGPMVEVRSVLRGRRLTPEETFASYIAPDDYDSSLNRVHLIGVLSGGGNKVDLALRTNQMMTDFLLQNGASSITTPQFVKQVITLAGVTRLQQILAITDPDAKLEQLKLTALHYHVSLPEFADLDMDVHKKVRRAMTKRFLEPTIHQAKDFSLPSDLFHDASGVPVLNCADHTQLQGVFLVDASDASTFQASHAAAVLPCIMVVLGPRCPISDKTCQSCNLPATDTHDNKVVIAACVHTLGSAPATLLGTDQAEIAVEATSILAFTAWRSETTDQLWQQLCESPLRTIWKSFAIDSSKNVVTKPWGRSWRNDSTPTEPDHAQSFQVHVRVYTSITSAILAQSGAKGIFVNPKTADGNTIDPSFAIVWLRDKNRTQVLEEAQKIPEQAGLVLSFKGKRGYGIRVPSSIYEDIQGKLNPSLPKQAHIPATCYAKLSPLPHGVTQDDIRTWLEKQALKMRPIRSLAANTWLLAASAKVDACHYLWGRSTVLIAPVTHNPPPNPTILAGGTRMAPSKTSSTTASSSVDHPNTDSWDPWAQWNPSLGDGSSRHHFSDSSEPTRTWSSKTSQHSRSSVSGSTSQTSEIAIIQGQIRDLTKATQTSQDNEAKLRQEMQTEFCRVRGEMRSQIEASEQSVRSTLDQRIHCLERSLQDTNTSMKEGFSAILSKLGGPPVDDQAKRLKSDSTMQIEPPS